MTENDSHFYCGTTTGDVLEVDKNLHIEADESLTWQNRDLTAQKSRVYISTIWTNDETKPSSS